MFQPLNDKIVIRVLDPEDQTDGGVIIPDRAQRMQQRGIVEAVGPGRILKNGEHCPIPIEVGDEVVFSSVHTFGACTWADEDERLLVLKESDVMVILKTETAA